MKRLLLVRHAKSSWNNPSLSDAQRPLNTRGQRDAPNVGSYLSANMPAPEQIYTSPATRAATTASLIAACYQPKLSVQVIDDLYTFSAQQLYENIHTLPNEYTTLMLVSHNPGITDLVNHLCDTDIENVPTCGVADIQIAGAEWSAISPAENQLLAFITPKSLL